MREEKVDHQERTVHGWPSPTPNCFKQKDRELKSTGISTDPVGSNAGPATY